VRCHVIGWMRSCETSGITSPARLADVDALERLLKANKR
jgi:hypothetical protein